MAVDKLVDSTQLDTDLTSIANAIRTKGGTSASLAFPAGFVSAIEAIETGGGGSNPLTLLTEIHVSSNVRSVAVTPDSSWFDYDFLIIRYDISLTGSDWIYASKTNTSGGGYTDGSVTEYKYVGAANKRGSQLQFIHPYFLGAGILNVVLGETVYYYTYSSGKAIASGSSITVYGGYNADL